jgi:hypothetical protein
MSEATIEVYAEDLRDCDREALAAAVVALRRTNKWLPTIAEIRQRLASDTLPLAVDASLAWHDATGLMSGIGSYGVLGGAGSPYVNRALRLCGRWEDICQEDATWLRKRFVEIYERLVEEAQRSMQVDGVAPAWLEHRGRPALPAPESAYQTGLSALLRTIGTSVEPDKGRRG